MLLYVLVSSSKIQVQDKGKNSSPLPPDKLPPGSPRIGNNKSTGKMTENCINILLSEIALVRSQFTLLIWKKKNSKTRKLRKISELQVGIELTALRVLIRML